MVWQWTCGTGQKDGKERRRKSSRTVSRPPFYTRLEGPLAQERAIIGGNGSNPFSPSVAVTPLEEEEDRLEVGRLNWTGLERDMVSVSAFTLTCNRPPPPLTRHLRPLGWCFHPLTVVPHLPSHAATSYIRQGNAWPGSSPGNDGTPRRPEGGFPWLSKSRHRHAIVCVGDWLVVAERRRGGWIRGGGQILSSRYIAG